MEKGTGPAAGIRAFARWAITPPQSYALYLGALILIFVGSFYAGTMKPKNAVGLTPPAAAVPHK